MSAFLQGSGFSAEEAADLGDDLVSDTKISPAVLNLQRVYEQNRQRLEQIESGIMPDATAQQQPAAKGAPRLLLMGQRRYVIFLVCQFARVLTSPKERQILHFQRRLSQAPPQRDTLS